MSNALASKPVTVAVVGPNYSGKTTMVKLLEEKLGFTIVQEKWWENPFFRYQPDDYFRSQVWYLLQTAKAMEQAAELKKKGTNVLLDTFIYSTLIFSRTKLNDEDFEAFQELLEMVAEHLPFPDLVIYLYADVKYLYNVRRVKRVQDGTGPKADATAKFEWLEQICELHNTHFAQWNKTKILKVNVEEVDILKEEDLKKLLDDARALLA